MNKKKYINKNIDDLMTDFIKNKLIDSTTTETIENVENSQPSQESETIDNTETKTETTDMEEDIPSIDEIELTSKEKLYFRMVNKYFKNLSEKKIDLMISIITGKSKISLRLLDWFVTRYSNKFKICFKLDKDTDYYNSEFNVYISYKAQLKSFKKRYFDPFRRKKKKKFYYYFDPDKKLCTTIGQLNFFRWAYNNEIIKYVETHFDNIKKAMDTTNKEEKVKKIKNKQDPENITIQKKTIIQTKVISAKSNQTVHVVKEMGKPINKNPANNIAPQKIILSFD